MRIQCVWEHNGDDSLLYATDFVGAYTRGENKEIAAGKMRGEIAAYLRWRGMIAPEEIEIELIQEKKSELDICDADSDVLFMNETVPLTQEEYNALKALTLKSAVDFQLLYDSIPDKNMSVLPARNTFYGSVPRTAAQMYIHTKNVNAYYFGEIDIDADNEGSIVECRERGFTELEKKPYYLMSAAIDGSYGELWSTRKVLRRFLWHDRIHAKAMYRMAVKTFGKENIPNIFWFNL